MKKGRSREIVREEKVILEGRNRSGKCKGGIEEGKEKVEGT